MPPFNRQALTDGQRALAARNVGLVYALVRQMLCDRPSVRRLSEEDAMGEGMMALCKAARGYRGGGFCRYACRTIKTEVGRAARRNGRRPHLAVLGDAADPREASPGWQGGDVEAMLGRLGERERRVLRLSFGLDGTERTLRETGEALGLPRETVREVRRRALEKLRERAGG